MAQRKVPDAPREYATRYNQLLGVDFQADQTEVNRRRSPDMVNMISDLGGNPVKRSGYRSVGLGYAGIASAGGSMWGVRRQTNGVRIYRLEFTNTGIEIIDNHLLDYSEHAGEAKYLFGFRDKLYVLCEKAWFEHDIELGTTRMIGCAEDVLYTNGGNSFALKMPDKSIIPTIMTMYKPNGTEMVALPEGTDITGATQGVNLLTPFRIVEYCVQTDTADETKFVIPSVSQMSNVVKVEVRSSSTYEWIDAQFTLPTATSRATILPDDPNTASSTDLVSGYITLASAPYIKVVENNEPYLRFRDAQTVAVPAGEPNVRVTFAPFSAQTTGTRIGFYNETRNKVINTNAAEMYDARIFAAEGTDAYYSRVSNFFMIDDDFYFSVDNDIMMFAKTSSSLAVIGEDTGSNTIYLAKGEYNETLAMPVYKATASNASVGCIAPKVTGNLNDEPLLLSRSGIYGLSTNYLSEKYAISRSGKINRRLCREDNLENAVGITFNNYFYVAINGRMYVLDGRHRDQSRNGDSSYECYYFEGMPDIERMYVVDGRMYFADNTHIYTWNDDMPETVKYYDRLVIDSQTGEPSGDPVEAKWSSLFDDDGAPQKLKTLMKKGTVAVLIPHYTTSCEVTLVKDGDIFEKLGTFKAGMTTFEYIDFSAFSFSSNAVAVDVFTKKKIKKYKRLQIILENKNAEPFGITQIVKTYTFGNYAKR